MKPAAVACPAAGIVVQLDSLLLWLRSLLSNVVPLQVGCLKSLPCGEGTGDKRTDAELPTFATCLCCVPAADHAWSNPVHCV